ncbi:hypothetical protein JTB14_000940 [Gonioctena quinquepunctata]|nr:hypothetical protein JTB14_000940 [Gonioctena quinquepunctata]
MAKLFHTLSGDLKMPSIGLGTWQATDEPQLERALEIALECGYRHIDTAFVYRNEAVIGRVLKKWFECGKLKREDIFITTKLPSQGVHKDRVELFLKKSLDALQLEYVDLYLIHMPIASKYSEGKNDAPSISFDETDHIAVWKKMEEQVKLGRTKTIGLSNFNIRQIEKIAKSAEIPPACLQVELHVYLQQRELVDYCQKNNIVVVAYSPLGTPGFNTFLTNIGKQVIKLPDVLNNEEIKKIAAKHNKTTAQVALRFLLERDIVVIPKSVTPARLKENLGITNFTLDNNDMESLYGLEVGEDARILNFKQTPGYREHPEFPFGK